MTAEEIITLAKLPSRKELLAKLAGALLGNITKLAVALDQVKDQKLTLKINYKRRLTALTCIKILNVHIVRFRYF